MLSLKRAVHNTILYTYEAGKNYLSAKQKYYSVCKLGFLFDFNWIQYLTVMDNETRQRSSSASKLMDEV